MACKTCGGTPTHGDGLCRFCEPQAVIRHLEAELEKQWAVSARLSRRVQELEALGAAVVRTRALVDETKSTWTWCPAHLSVAIDALAAALHSARTVADGEYT